MDWFYRDWEVGDYGAQVGSADINGDGVDEAIVGDPGWWYNNPSFPPGRVYIYKNPYTAVEEEQTTPPHNFELSQNYPNPFNSETQIKYALPQESNVRLVIYNILGQKVRVLVEDFQEHGYYTISWDGKNEQGEAVGSGIYFYRIQAGSFTKTAKMSLLK